MGGGDGVCCCSTFGASPFLPLSLPSFLLAGEAEPLLPGSGALHLRNKKLEPLRLDLLSPSPAAPGQCNPEGGLCASPCGQGKASRPLLLGLGQTLKALPCRCPPAPIRADELRSLPGLSPGTHPIHNNHNHKIRMRGEYAVSLSAATDSLSFSLTHSLFRPRDELV